MKRFNLLAISSLVLVSSTATFANTYAGSCSTALEKLHTARKALIPLQHSMERARIHERVAVGETLTCGPGKLSSVQHAQRCSRATWEAPQRINATREAENVYLQERRALEEQFGWIKQICLLAP